MVRLTCIGRGHEYGKWALVVVQHVFRVGNAGLGGDLDKTPLGRVGFGQAVLVHHFPYDRPGTVTDGE